ALRRAFARAGLEVQWIETPGEISGHEVVASLPNLPSLHRLLGLDEAALLRAARGCFTLGQQYVGLAGGDAEFLHSYGPVGRPFAGMPFLQFWLKAHAAGLPAGLGDFAREGVAARNGRLRVGDSKEHDATAHGYHLDARGYAGLVRAHAAREGVTIVADAAPQAIAESGRVASLRLSDGRIVAGDLFVDATPSARILAALGDGDPVDAAVSSCDRLLRASGTPLRPLPLYSRIAAHRAGWSALYPLQDRTGAVVAYDSAHMSDDEAAAHLGLQSAATPECLPLSPTQRSRPWIGNVVAVGEAMGRGEPFAATALHRLQIAVTHLVSLFPVDADAMPEAGIYNEELTEWHARLQDFNAMAYALNGRTGEPFWDAARTRPVSEALDARIGLFGARGVVAAYNQDSFAEDEWQTCFLGLGLVPRSWDPQADHADEQAVMADFRDHPGERGFVRLHR
ncbi:MAG: hypothetical protein EOP59_15270, partial [Sphingomonadales bacterium]